MSVSSRFSSVLAALALVCGVTVPRATAADFVGMDGFAKTLYDLDTQAGTTTLLGAITGGPNFGFGAIDRAPDGTLWAVAPGAASGYSLYTIDETTLTATLKWTIATNCTGNVGIAIEPSGTGAWVAGFVGFSLIVKVQRVTLSTGAMVEKGSLGGNFWGLGFNDVGELFTTTQGSIGPRLVKVNQTNAANSTFVGSDMTSVDMSMGLDLASSVNATGLTLYSRATGTVFEVDTTTGVETVIGNPGVSSVTSFAANDPCGGDADEYGVGCAGTGGFVPSLSIEGCPQVGDLFSVEIANGLGSAPAVLLIGLGQGSIPVGGGCSLLVTPLAPVSLTVPLGGFGPGTGSLSIPLIVTPNLAGADFTLQVWVVDGATGVGGAGSNGVHVHIL
ncbi:MAG: hypothetical protein IPH13_19130 [Planctomycetes bacterium]|nr:hypothetical protein [Planctomycetota bacterium]MCC7169638.1 hypothetical protein [Planctomycetota bacterium]